MPRGPRLDGTGEAHHVMIRGIERRRIFICPADEDDFLERLDRLLPEENWRCFAWALMPNHVHLVIQSPTGSLSRLMARLNTGYARGFNLRHQRSGYLFQNRFKSRLVTDEADLLGLVRYVLRNPLTDRLVPDLEHLETYRGCGYGSLIGRKAPRRFEAISECLAMFGDDTAEGLARLRQWMAGDFDIPQQTAVPPAPRPRAPAAIRPVLGGTAPRAIKILIPPGASADSALALLTEHLCEAIGVATDSARVPGRRGPEADVRAILCSTAVDQLQIGRRTIADHLGISRTAVSHAARKGRARLGDRAFRIEIRRAAPGGSDG